MKKRILIVEDNPANLMLEKDLLESAGFEVVEAADAGSGLEAARRERPDLIVMDVRLPDMRGTEAALRLRQDPGTKAIPIVFVTTSIFESETAEFKKITASSYLSKPINTRTFAKSIADMLPGGPGAG
jgi:CheY-like chemotaxis protein